MDELIAVPGQWSLKSCQACACPPAYMPPPDELIELMTPVINGIAERIDRTPEQ